MNWTTPADVRAQVQRYWDKGELLSAAAGMPAGTPFPRRLACRAPGSADMVSRFDEVRRWSAALCGMRHVRIAMREFRHPVLGRNALPAELWIDTLDDALAIAGKQREAQRFAALLAQTEARQPALLAWLAAQPLRALELAQHWPRLLDVVAWLQAHPRPGIYLRQVDLPGVHTKFIESQRAVLAELLDLALAPEAVNAGLRGTASFALRYGFRDKPARIRLRMLDPARRLLPTPGEQDMQLDAASFAALDPGISHVFITENEINYLAFPALADSMILFGAGYGFDMLDEAHWLARCQVHYWGDIDTHGYAILDQLRARLPHAASLMMDHATLMRFQDQWSADPKPVLRDLPRLTAAESAVYDALRDQRLGGYVRLEQELIGFGWVRAALAALPVALL